MDVYLFPVNASRYDALTTTADYWKNSSVTATFSSDDILLVQEDATLTVETTAPIIAKIDAGDAANGTYGVGSTIPITIYFKNGAADGDDETVIQSGNSYPVISLNSDRDIEINTFSTTSAVGNYIVNTGDTGGSNLVATGTIDLTNVTVVDDPHGNALILTDLPADNFDEDDILIDVTPPSLESITTIKINDVLLTPSVSTTKWLKKDDIMLFTLDFNEDTRLYGSATITLNANSSSNPTLSAYNASPPYSDPVARYTVQEDDFTDPGADSWLVRHHMCCIGYRMDDESL